MKKGFVMILLGVAVGAVAATVEKFGAKVSEVGVTPVVYHVTDPYAPDLTGRVMKLTVVNVGHEDLYYWYNVSTNTFNTLQAQGHTFVVPPGMMDVVSEPVSGIRSLIFSTKTNTTSVVLRGADA